MASAIDVDMTKGIPRDCIECDGPDCSNKAPGKRCSRCHTEYYCSVDCQKKNWKQHKPYCIPIEEMKLRTAGVENVAVAPDDEDTEGINTECGICLEERIQNRVVLKECRHAFCCKCLIEWQSSHAKALLPRASKAGSPCPLCRCESEDVEQSLIERALLLGTRASSRNVTDESEREVLWQKSLSCIEKVLLAEGFNIVAYFTKAEALIALKRQEEAIKALDQMIEEDKKRKEHPVIKLLEREEEARERGNFHLAEQLREEVVDASEIHGLPACRVNEYTNIDLLKCEAYESQGAWESAIKIYRRLLQNMPTPESGTAVQQRKIFMGFARCFFGLKDYEKALSASEAALAMNRHFPGVHKIKAQAEKAMGNLDEATKTMNCAVLYEAPWDDVHRAEVLDFYKELLAEQAA